MAREGLQLRRPCTCTMITFRALDSAEWINPRMHRAELAFVTSFFIARVEEF